MPVFTEDRKQVLKFDTLKSYQYFIDCKDNHKSYQALEIFLIGTTMELLRLYSSTIKGAPTVDGFTDWSANVENPTLNFVCQFTLNFVLAVYVTRIGDRFNDAKCGKTGRMKFSTFGLHCFAFFNCDHFEARTIELHEKHVELASISKLMG